MNYYLFRKTQTDPMKIV